MQLSDLLKNKSVYWRKNARDPTRKNNILVRKQGEKYQIVYSWEVLLLSLFLKVFPWASAHSWCLYCLPSLWNCSSCLSERSMLLNKQTSAKGDKKEKREGDVMPSTVNKLPKSHPWTWLKFHSGDVSWHMRIIPMVTRSHWTSSA